MQAIGKEDIQKRIERDNPWWDNPVSPVLIPEANNPRRVYFNSFKQLALDFSVRRATVLLGPRRVGKTFMLKQLVHEAILSGIRPRCILFASIDAPIYSGMSLEGFVDLLPREDMGNKSEPVDGRKVVIFDEIQYLRNWEVHLKDLVDSYDGIKFIATGSAAAALRLKSQESGAGRFSDFMLPALTFYEFLDFQGVDSSLIAPPDESLPKGLRYYRAKDIRAVNSHFIDYLNFGGYPEAVLNKSIRLNSDQFIRNDIIDKVLLKDLPSLYGIHEIQELNKLFSFLAYNAGNEASFENISQESGITKPTIKRYIEYLESAFLIMKLSNVDENCRTMKRERTFKIYLNNPSMRAALFAPVEAEDTERIGHLVESAIFSQWQHAQGFRNLRYARWRNEGEVDIVYLTAGGQKPSWIGEIKWSDRITGNQYNETKSLRVLVDTHKSITSGFITTRTITGEMKIGGRHITIVPSSMYCYTIGRNITSRLDNLSQSASEIIDEEDNRSRIEVDD